MADLLTYGDVVTQFFSMIGDDEVNQRLATTDQVDVWANSVMVDLAEHAGYIDDYVAATTAPAKTVSYADADATILSLWRVEIDDEVIYPITTKQLYQSTRTWREDTGEPRYYFLDSLRGIGSDNYTVGFYPYSTTNYKIGSYFTKSGEALSYANKANNVTLPAWATPALLWGILMHYYEHSGRKQNSQTAELYRTLYIDIRSRLRSRTTSRQGTCDIWGAGRTYVPAHDWRGLIPSEGVTGY